MDFNARPLDELSRQCFSLNESSAIVVRLSRHSTGDSAFDIALMLSQHFLLGVQCWPLEIFL